MRTANTHYTKRLQQKHTETRTKALQYRPTSLITKKIAPKMKRRKYKGKSKFGKVHGKVPNVVKNIEKKIGVEVLTKPVQHASGIRITKDVKWKCDDDFFVPVPKRVKVLLMNIFKE